MEVRGIWHLPFGICHLPLEGDGGEGWLGGEGGGHRGGMSLQGRWLGRSRFGWGDGVLGEFFWFLLDLCLRASYRMGYRESV